MERRLAVILAADVVGYSALMERDEAGTYERLVSGRKDLFEPEIRRYNGRIFKLMGDGLLAEFDSVVNAVECAVSLQAAMAERASSVPEAERMRVRIGVNLGEVIVDGDDRYGEGVNIAARLEQLAEPGKVYVSGKVAQEVSKRLALTFESMGEQRVKNIAEPVAIYRVVVDPVPSTAKAGRVRPLRRNRLVAGAIALVLLLLAGGGVAVWQSSSRPAVTARQQPSIAVLPFVNMGGDPSQDYFGQGVAEDIITMLSTYPIMRVISRSSSFVYDKPIKVQRVGEELGVDYVLEGSVRKLGEKVQVTAQLIDAKDGEHVWANRFDEVGTEVTKLQERVALQVYDTIAGSKGEIRKAEEQVAWSKSAPSLGEYDYYLRGHKLLLNFNEDDVLKARAIWLEGLQRFPDSTLLRAKLIFTYTWMVMNGYSRDPWADVETAWKFGKDAEAAPTKSRLETMLTHWAMTYLYWMHDADFEKSAAEAEATADMVPFDQFTRADVAQFLVYAGHAKRAEGWLEEAIQREKNPPDWYFGNLGFAYYVDGRADDAITAYDHMVNKDSWAMGIAAASVRAGKIDEARTIVARYLAANPGHSLKDEELWPTKRKPGLPAFLMRPFLDDLRKAGVPDG